MWPQAGTASLELGEEPDEVEEEPDEVGQEDATRRERQSTRLLSGPEQRLVSQLLRWGPSGLAPRLLLISVMCVQEGSEASVTQARRKPPLQLSASRARAAAAQRASAAFLLPELRFRFLLLPA